MSSQSLVTEGREALVTVRSGRGDQIRTFPMLQALRQQIKYIPTYSDRYIHAQAQNQRVIKIKKMGPFIIATAHWGKRAQTHDLFYVSRALAKNPVERNIKKKRNYAAD